MSNDISRRQLLSTASTIAGASMIGSQITFAEDEKSDGGRTEKRPLIISTWPFGKPGNEVALKTVEAGKSTLDAVEAGIRHVEASGNQTVGLSGKPNAAGFAQLDACIMHGPGHKAGSVAAIEGIKHPISVARRVMEKTPHVMLAGDGARWFALQEGFESIDISERPKKVKAWKKEQKQRRSEAPAGSAENHDTITMLVLGPDGTLSGGCSTSGLADKLPGRVGDSPILGGGLYVDNKVGAAGATGIGENVMRYCATFMIVEFMRQGLSPTDACKKIIERIKSYEPENKNLAINFIAIDKQGRFGAAGTDKFPHSVTYPGFSEVLTADAV
ncbi:MAG: N(4)-(beta-N-acetylglucosaminyl)-L-asparaginase [Planctomycetales bacterium]|nr:N(4)-(beta-N-acetylglucosaminyl)-L-asparaginase [Planctomycetales bacterium]